MVGDRELCARLAERLTHQAGALRTPLTDAHTCAARGQLALLDGDAERAAADLANATAAYVRCGYRFDAGRTGLSLARAWLRCGRRSNARAAAGAARQSSTTPEHRSWAASADDLLARAQASAAGGSLTGTETQIASLVAAGLLNREIATELFISISTVEAHLTRIYRKLGLRRRTELTNYIHANG